MNKRGFASDNNSGVTPDILAAIQEANTWHTIAYGDDPWTEKAKEELKKHFGDSCDIYFVFTGTAANTLGLDAVTQPYNSIICAETAHINVDECGAPEKFTGCKILTVETPDGKLTVGGIKKHMHGFGFEHHSQPGVISITQVTEMGTVYTIDEIRTIAQFAHEKGMLLHMDGARISNAAVSLGVPFREFTVDAGVDILSFGGTKNGMMYGEAVIFFNRKQEDFKYRRKQGMQLASKMRFISAQFTAFLQNDHWKKNAEHANKMARLLEKEVQKIKNVQITQKVEANGVFAILPKDIIPSLQEKYFFYVWDEATGEVRWMTSYDTAEEDIMDFTAILKQMV